MLLQLVLQFRGKSLSQSLPLDALESRIKPVLSGSESFDGIDARQQSVNIFLYTEDPTHTFERVRPVFEEAEHRLDFTAAYRLVSESRFRVLWPKDAEEFELRPKVEATREKLKS